MQALYIQSNNLRGYKKLSFTSLGEMTDKISNQFYIFGRFRLRFWISKDKLGN